MSGFWAWYVGFSEASRDDLTWTLCSLAVVFTTGRFYIRYRHRPLRSDDVFCGLATISLIIFAAIIQLDGNVGNDTDPNYTEVEEAWRFELAADMLGWLILYAVKASFLALCRSVFGFNKTFRTAWWIVTAYTFLSFWPILLAQLWQCGNPGESEDPNTCSAWNGNDQYEFQVSEFATALHISSDCFILGLPIPMIWKLQISRAQKVSVFGVFALVIVDIAMGIMRNAAFISVGAQGSEASAYIASVMAICEPSLAVIVCTLPAYRVLLPYPSRRPHQLLPLTSSVGMNSELSPQMSYNASGDHMDVRRISELPVLEG